MIELDRNADTFPAGLAGTPFEEVYRALRIVAATVWDVDPLVYRAGMAWGWYALHDPAALVGFRDVVTAALISAMAPMVKETQTDAERVEYLRQWRSYTPTFPKLQALYALFGAVVDIQPISDPESQAVLPVDDTRLAFYLRIESVDFSRPLSLSEAREIAVRATPLGSRPYPYYALETHISCTVSPAPVGIYIRLENWETARPPAPAQQLGELVFVDASTGAVVYSVESLNEMVFTETGYFTIEDGSDVVFVQPSQYPVVSMDTYAPDPFPETIVDGGVVNTVYQYYSSKLYIVMAVVSDTTYGVIVESVGWDMSTTPGDISITNNTGASKSIFQLHIFSMDATDAEVVEIKNQSDEHFYAFKWASNGTPYWHVVAWTHFWTDDLAAEGYEEVPSVVLPTVTMLPTVGLSGQVQSVAANGNTGGLRGWDSSSGDYTGNYIEFDIGSEYASIEYASGGSGWSRPVGIFEPTSVTVSGTNVIGAKNVSGTSQNFGAIKIARCISSAATVVTVYNSSNVAYNAFKFIASGTDYYYVLDGAQSDWTDDLASIGYSLSPGIIDVFLYLSPSLSSVNFSSNDYWAGIVIDETDKAALQAFGVTVSAIDGHDVIGRNQQGTSFSFSPIGLYSGVREGDLQANMSNFYCADGRDNPSSVYYGLCIKSINAYSTQSKTWKCRITKL